MGAGLARLRGTPLASVIQRFQNRNAAVAMAIPLPMAQQTVLLLRYVYPIYMILGKPPG